MGDDEPSPPPVPRKAGRKPLETDAEAVQAVIDAEIEAFIAQAYNEDYTN